MAKSLRELLIETPIQAGAAVYNAPHTDTTSMLGLVNGYELLKIGGLELALKNAQAVGAAELARNQALGIEPERQQTGAEQDIPVIGLA